MAEHEQEYGDGFLLLVLVLVHDRPYSSSSSA
jgi:hypothetical protein